MTNDSALSHVPDQATTFEDWSSVLHDPVLPSGRKVVYRDMSLADLATVDELPDDLLELVVAEWAEPGSAARMALEPYSNLPDKPTKKQREEAERTAKTVFEKLARINRHQIAYALVEPKLTVDQLEQVPTPDLEMLAALINRRISHDALGRNVGVVPLDSFRVVLGAHGHEPCPADCPACAEAGRQLATLL